MNYFLMFEAGVVVSDFVREFIPIVRIIFLIAIAICAIVLIISTLLQSSANPAGSSAISGGSDSYLSHTKDNSRDGRLKRITIWMASLLVVFVVLYFFTGIWLDFPKAI
ncbi:MAG: preprotein translocase subunit SecG [Clostridia bacterium]|nr:preprotein translocase subunit SecG [Clostridia bacterium]MDD4686365.1 preprotein translocase subunit SecG [Clostridia bacterium]